MGNSIDIDRLGGVLQQAQKENWDTQVPAQVPAKLTLAINSLMRADKMFWQKDADYVTMLLEQNPGVRKIFYDTDDNLLAFAIRQARM